MGERLERRTGPNRTTRPLLALFIALATIGVHARTRDVAPEAQRRSSVAQLETLLDEDGDAYLRRNPIHATVRGIPGYGHLLPNQSLAELGRERARERRTLERLRVLDSKALHGQDRISYELLLDKMDAWASTASFHAVVIDNGSIPLAVLERIVDEWIARGGGQTGPD